MPASCANAFAPTTALFGATTAPVISVSNRLDLKSSSSLMFVVTPKLSLRTASATAISSSAAFPARSPIPFTVHSICRTPARTAASELARNTLDYGGGGSVLAELVEVAGRRGLRLTFEDKGPGIADIEAALKDGYTSGKGMGLGLGGAKRLSNEFSIHSKPGEGTKVVIARWK